MLLIGAIAVLMLALPFLIFGLERRHHTGIEKRRAMIFYSGAGLLVSAGLTIAFFLTDPVFTAVSP